MKPLVTIITPSYNHARYLVNTVNSVFQQTYENIEYIIIDDGSTDNSHEVIKTLAETYPQIIYRLYNENMGHYRLNEAIELAKGEYISILSSDDWYLPEKIKKQVDRFNELDESYGVVYSAGYRFYEDTGEMLEPATNKIMKRGNILKNLLTEPFFIYPISPLFKKECFLKYAFSKEYKAEGEALYYKIAIDYKFDFVDEPLVVMRDHSKNTGKEVYVMHNDNIKYLKELLLLKNFPEPMKKYVYKKIGHTYFYNGWHMLRRNNDKSGWLNMKKALEYNKGFLLNPRFYIALFSRFGF